MKALIFDMDGVLIDSEPLHYDADMTLLPALGIHVEKTYLDRYVGVTDPVMWRQIARDFSLQLDIEEILQRQLDTKLRFLAQSDLQAIDGIAELIHSAHDRQIPMAIASSSSKDFIDAVIDKIGIGDFIAQCVSGQEVAKSKPEPDIFLKAAALLGEEALNCIVIEDSHNGVSAAKRAGMCCVAYRNPNSGKQDLSEADIIIDSFRELDIDTLTSLCKTKERTK